MYTKYLGVQQEKIYSLHFRINTVPALIEASMLSHPIAIFWTPQCMAPLTLVTYSDTFSLMCENINLGKGGVNK
jgi:hypothetical protein